MRMKAALFKAKLLVLAFTMPAFVPSVIAQVGGPQDYQTPTEYGVRITPSMARTIGDVWVKHLFVRRYKLDEEYQQQASEAIARRFMEFAHRLDTPEQQAAVEEMITGVLNAVADNTWEEAPGMPPGMAETIARGVRPMMPEIRELVKGVGNDVRPMLPIQKQLLLGRDMLATGKVLDSMEQTFSEWEQGQVNPYGNPFQPRDREIRLDANGESNTLKRARLATENEVERHSWVSDWELYVEQAKEYYELDEAQAAVAESMLREAIEQAQVIAQSPDWKDQLFRNRLWYRLTQWTIRQGRHFPLPALIQQGYEDLMRPIHQIGDDLKRDIGRIPTNMQKRKARLKIEAALEQKGYGEGSY